MADRTISDLAIAVYLRLRIKRDHLNMKNISIHSNDGRGFKFTFSDPDDLFDMLCMEYSISESLDFDNEMKTVKTIMRNKR